VALPTIQERLGVQSPLFVRKLSRQSHWGDPGDELSGRVAMAVREVFRSEPGETFSVYLLEKDEDLHRVALGLNANRSSLTETLALVGFFKHELEFCGISLVLSLGDTRCSGANRRHFDFSATAEQLTALCHNAMQAGRNAGRLNKPHMRPIIEKAGQNGCRAVVADSERCVCDDE
jgi:hypothetical protein